MKVVRRLEQEVERVKNIQPIVVEKPLPTKEVVKEPVLPDNRSRSGKAGKRRD